MASARRPSSGRAAGSSRKASRPRPCCAHGSRASTNAASRSARATGSRNRRTGPDLRDARWPQNRPPRRDLAGARRGELASPRLGRRLGAAPRSPGCDGLAPAPGQCRVRVSLVGALSRAARGHAAEARGTDLRRAYGARGGDRHAGGARRRGCLRPVAGTARSRSGDGRGASRHRPAARSRRGGAGQPAFRWAEGRFPLGPVAQGGGPAPVAIGLLREAAGAALPTEPTALARWIKAAPLTLTGTMGLDRAISTAGGVVLDALDGNAMLKAQPGLFLAGEMLDWEAPTGGYLLQGAISGGRAAAEGLLRWLGPDQGFRQKPTMPTASVGRTRPRHHRPEPQRRGIGRRPAPRPARRWRCRGRCRRSSAAS